MKKNTMKKLSAKEIQKEICNYASADRIRSIDRQIAFLQQQINILEQKTCVTADFTHLQK